MLNSLALAIRLLCRELRSGQWFIIFFSVLLAVTTITGLNFYSDRLTRGLEQQSTKLLGGDLVITSSLPIPDEWLQKANTLNLKTAQLWIYPSVVSTQNHLQLVNVQAVSNNYPLLSDQPFHLKPRSVLVEPRLLELLSIHLGDAVVVGALALQVQQILPSDMDMLNTGLVIAPRLMMRLEDVPYTKTVLPGSRVDYRLLITGEKETLKSYRQWITSRLQPGQRLLDINHQGFGLRDSLVRAENYIQLVLLLSLIMSGVAIALSTRQYLNRHYSHIALWRCLGAGKNQIMLIFFWQLIIVSISAGIAGSLTGYLLQEAIARVFNDFFRFPLPAVSFSPIVLGFVTSLLLVFTYAYPIISELPKTPPVFLWRNETGINPVRKNTYLIIALGVLLVYVYWIMDYALLALFILDALLLSIGFIYALSLFTLSVIRKILDNTQGIIRRGLSQLVHHPENTSLQLTAFTLILMSLIVLAMVKNNLLENWQQSLPKNTPNYFAFNIAPSDLAGMREYFTKQDIVLEGIYPMIRGRVVALNGKPVMQAVPESGRLHNTLHRELNLSSFINYPSDNHIISGHAWTDADKGKHLISVEKSMADNLQLKLGDELTFQIGDKKISAVISNIRTLNWESFHPNFYIIFPPGLLDGLPATFITSFHLKTGDTRLLNDLVNQFPNITIIDVASTLKQIQDLLAKIALALQYLFLSSLGLAILIFIISLMAGMDERRQTGQLLRVLGANKKYIHGSLLIEFSFLLVLTAAFSFALAKTISYLLMKSVFSG